MGPSGCGKSTLLDTLAGRLASSATSEGDIRVNGHKASLSYGGAAYVTQDEVLIGTLTVRETLMFVARLRLPPATTPKEREGVVKGVITELGLDSVQHTCAVA
jgi:ABC-type multidrug transport system ATPase subunit